MPGENIQDWSTTAANNSNADSSINWAEGQARASVNNSARAMMAAHAKDRNLHNGSIVTAGTANAQIFFSGIDYTIVPTGLRVTLKIGPTLTNTAAATLNMDNIGAVSVLTMTGAALTGGELTAGTYVDFLYDGTTWVLTGFVTSLLASRSMFRAGLTGDQLMGASASPQQIAFLSEGLDNGGNYDSALGLWTPPAGRVMLTTTLWTLSTVALIVANFGFRKNSVSDVGATSFNYPFQYGSIAISTVDIATGTDTYSVWATFPSGGTILVGSLFTGTLV